MTSLHGGTAPLAALTTVFTPSCSTTWLVTTTKLPSQFPSFPSAGPTTCDPPAWASNLAGEGFQYYSPAICPSGFQVGVGCSFTATSLTSQGFPAVAPGETVAWCVPSGQTCTSDTTDFHGGIWGAVPTSTASNAAFTVGPAMQIRWRDADLTVLATHPLTPGLTLAGTTSTVAATTPTATSTSKSKTSASLLAAATTTTRAVRTLTASANDDGDDGDDDDNDDNSGTSVANTASSTIVATGTASSITTGRAVSTASPLQTTTATESTQTAAAARAYHKRTLIGVAVMAAVLGLTIVGIAVFFVVAHRRHDARQLPEPDGGMLEEDGASPDRRQMRAVGLGAWTHRRQWSESQGERRWWPARLVPRTLLSGDDRGRLPFFSSRHNDRRASQAGSPVRRRRLDLGLPSARGREGQEAPEMSQTPQAPQTPQTSTSQTDANVSSELPIEIRIHVGVLPPIYDRRVSRGSSRSSKSSRRNRSSSRSSSGSSVAEVDVQKFQNKGSQQQQQQQRWSWMSRLSRYMRGVGVGTSSGSDESTRSHLPGENDNDAISSSNRSRVSRRWSRWTTRTDTESQGGVSSVTDGEPVDESSWEAFSRARSGGGGGVAKVVVIAKAGRAAGGSGGGRNRGLTVPQRGRAASLLRVPSPARTLSSLRSGRTTRTQSPAEGIRDDHSRFSRLSDGTFGHLGSTASGDGGGEA